MGFRAMLGKQTWQLISLGFPGPHRIYLLLQIEKNLELFIKMEFYKALTL